MFDVCYEVVVVNLVFMFRSIMLKLVRSLDLTSLSMDLDRSMVKYDVKNNDPSNKHKSVFRT